MSGLVDQRYTQYPLNLALNDGIHVITAREASRARDLVYANNLDHVAIVTPFREFYYDEYWSIDTVLSTGKVDYHISIYADYEKNPYGYSILFGGELSNIADESFSHSTMPKFEFTGENSNEIYNGDLDVLKFNGRVISFEGHTHSLADFEETFDRKFVTEEEKNNIALIPTINTVIGNLSKVEASSTNGQIKIDGVETVVYKEPIKVVKNVSSDYTVLNTDDFVIANSSSAQVVLTLPDASAIMVGRVIFIKNVGANGITINTVNSQTINGESSKVLTSDQESVKIFSDGTSYHIY